MLVAGSRGLFNSRGEGVRAEVQEIDATRPKAQSIVISFHKAAC